MLNKDQLKDLQEVVEEQLTQVMSGVYPQDMDTTKRVFEEECNLKSLIAALKTEIKGQTELCAFIFKDGQQCLTTSFTQHKILEPVIKQSEDDPTRCYRIYEAPKNCKYLYTKEMTDEQLGCFLKGVKYKLVFEHVTYGDGSVEKYYQL